MAHPWWRRDRPGVLARQPPSWVLGSGSSGLGGPKESHTRDVVRGLHLASGTSGKLVTRTVGYPDRREPDVKHSSQPKALAASREDFLSTPFMRAAVAPRLLWVMLLGRDQCHPSGGTGGHTPDKAAEKGIRSGMRRLGEKRKKGKPFTPSVLPLAA